LETLRIKKNRDSMNEQDPEKRGKALKNLFEYVDAMWKRYKPEGEDDGGEF